MPGSSRASALERTGTVRGAWFWARGLWFPSPGYAVLQKTSLPREILLSESGVLGLFASAGSRSRVGSGRLGLGSARGSSRCTHDSSPGAPAAGCWVALEGRQLLDRLGSTPVPEPSLDRLGAGCWVLGSTGWGPDRPRPAVAGRFRPPDHPATPTASPFLSLGLVSLK